MIGSEMAECAALGRRAVAREGAADGRDPYGLGWVADWLYGDAVLPPMPLPREPEAPLPWRRPPLPVHASAPTSRERQRDRRRARQLALL